MNNDIKDDNIPIIRVYFPYTERKVEHNGDFTYAKSF